MAEQDVTVSTKLVIDDQTTEVLKRIQSEYKETQRTKAQLEREASQQSRRTVAEEKRQNADRFNRIVDAENARGAAHRKGAERQLTRERQLYESSGGFVKQFAATLLAVNFMPAVNQARMYASELFRVATAEEENIRAMTGLVSGIQGVPWSVAARGARELDDQLENVAIESHKLVDDVERGFNSIIEFMGGTEEAFRTAKDQVGPLASIAEKTGKTVAGLGEDFGVMAQGIMRPRNELFNLLKGTGVFGSDIRKAREEWGKLTERERLERMNRGIALLAGNLKNVQPTFRDLMTTVDNIKTVGLEEFGKSVLSEVLPEFKALTGDIEGSQEKIKEYARSLGKDVGGWVRDATKLARDAFFYLRSHAEEIRDAVKEGFAYAKSVAEFIIAHKGTLAAAFGVRALAGSRIGSMVGGVAAAGAAGTSVAGVGLAGAAGAAASVAALAVAIGGLGAAAYQAVQLYKEMGGGKTEAEQDMDAIATRWKQIAASGSTLSKEELKQMDHERVSYAKLARARHMDSEAAGMYLDSLYEQHKAIKQSISPLQEAARGLEQARDAAAAAGDEFGVDVAMQDEVIGKIMNEFQAAVSDGKTGMAQQIAQIIAGSTSLQQALLESGNVTAESLQIFADNLTEKNADFKAKLEKLAATTSKLEKPQVSNNFYGGQTFKITQDFRDEDPDRVAFFFQRDVARAAMRRGQAGTSAPFGT